MLQFMLLIGLGIMKVDEEVILVHETGNMFQVDILKTAFINLELLDRFRESVCSSPARNRT